MLRPRLTVAQLSAFVLFAGVVCGTLAIINTKNAQIADLTQRVKHAEAAASQNQGTVVTIARDCSNRFSAASALNLPDGYVMGVDYRRREVVIDINGDDAARPGMRMAIFESASPTIDRQLPKGTIELIQVGEHVSTARIREPPDQEEPIMVGDLVYSPAWSPGQSMRFALIGKIDRNRDGKDDRAELKRIIEQAGGVIDFDLPPPDIGPETGALSPRVDWYVQDVVYDAPIRDVQFAKRVGAAIKNARLNGIRPMPLDRLLHLLGYL